MSTNQYQWIVSSFRFPFKSERRTSNDDNDEFVLGFYRMLAKKEMWKEDVATKVKAVEETVEEEHRKIAEEDGKQTQRQRQLVNSFNLP